MATASLSAEDLTEIDLEAPSRPSSTSTWHRRSSFDPDAMMGLADNAALNTVAADAKQRLTAALAALDAGEGAN